ncbi:MAG: RnfH family protein [Legionella sp.]|nr:MAG: RnfH family protein [Legionella sp.]PJE00050.1 MAG: RnfH family protein [Legionella sp.]
MVHVELVYIALNQEKIHHHLVLPLGATVADALEQAKLYDTHPETRTLTVGIYSKSVPLTQVLREGDRVELYRPLFADPKEKRRRLARAKK